MKIKILIICSLITTCLMHLPVSANMTKTKINILGPKLTKLVEKQKGKVGICFIDLKSGLKLSINGNKLFPAASVAKVPVMAAAYHLSDSQKIDLSEKIKFREEDKLGGSGVLQWMKVGREYSIRNLVRLMIVLSDNTATRLVINRLGTFEVNAYLEDLGIKNTRIVDNTCLNEAPNPLLNFTTPNEMALLLLEINNPGAFSKPAKQEMLNFMKGQRYRWGIWRGVPRGIIVADKTGNVEGVLNDAGIVFSKNGNYILSIFTNGFKKQKDARKLINKISKMVFDSTTRI